MKVVALLSGGIDSPVAAYVMAAAGAEVVLLHMDTSPDGSGGSDDKVVRLASRLSEAAGREMPAHVAPHGATTLSSALMEAPDRLRCVLCKRAMLRAAQALAGRVDARAIVTGESLGQVASQTLPNMRSEDAAVELPVLRPLVGLDKVEIIEKARYAGTFDISIDDAGGCIFVPSRPATATVASELEAAEDGMGAAEATGGALDGLRQVYPPRRLAVVDVSGRRAR